MKQSYYLFKSGRLQRKDNTLEIVYKDNSKRSIPIERVRDIYIMSEFDFNTSLLNFISTSGINLHFFNYYGFYTGTYYSNDSLVSGKLLVKQVESYLNNNKRVKITRAIIDAASYNIYRNLTYHVSQKLNIKNMQEAVKYFVGEHDFSSFKSSGTSSKSSVRTIYDAKVEKDKDKIIISLTGNGFLYNMVRIIAGTLLEVGLGNIKPEEIKDIIEAKNRQKTGKTLPPQGLFLMNVEYN